MGRLCERPGCSEPASVAYGMRAEDLVFWLAALEPDSDQSNGVLCRRHAESMVLPRHWTLDDLREPVPRLFRPPTAVPVATAPARRRRSSVVADGEQLLLDAEPNVASRSEFDAVSAVDVQVGARVDGAGDVGVGDALAESDAGMPAVSESSPGEATGDEPNGAIDAAVPWTPTFDESDDLDGLLSARSPLLARAFRGDDRPRQS